MLSAMRFKDFIWPHNPRVVRLQCVRRAAVLNAPGGRFQVQDLGATCRILRGEGEFYGPDAYATFTRLMQTFRSAGFGVLVHPVWPSSRMLFTRLELRQEPRADYVAYSFEFTEGRNDLPLLENAHRRSTSLPGQTHVVAAGDTVWSICSRYGLRVEDFLSFNPQIANPNFLIVGQEVALG